MISKKSDCHLQAASHPIGSIYGIYANIGGVLMVNVTIYSIHGSYRHSFCFFQYIFSGQNVSNRLGDFCLPESTRSFHYVSLLSWSLETMQKHGWLIVNICTDIDMYIVTYIYTYVYIYIYSYIYICITIHMKPTLGYPKSPRVSILSSIFG